MLRLTVLGSCGTYPGPGRACSGYLLEGTSGGRATRVWVDTGSGSLANLLRHTAIEDLDAIWVSHLHADHCTDLPVAYYALRYGAGHREEPLPVFGPAGWRQHMDSFLRTGGAGNDGPRTVADAFDIHELHDEETVRLGGLDLTAVATEHSVETYAVRARCDGATVAYSADSGPCEALGRLAAGSDLFVCEAAWLKVPEGMQAIHCTPEEAGTWAARAGARRLVLTHIRPSADPAAAVDMAGAAYGGPVGVALEGDSYEFGAELDPT